LNAVSGILSEELKGDIYLNPITPFRSMKIFNPLKELAQANATQKAR
jgi:hypothetical protein